MAVSKEQIISACETILQQNGKAPNQSQVRELLGGGSFSTIAPVLAEWKKERTETKLLPTSTAPEDVQKVADSAVAQIWQTAEKIAEERLASEREALKLAQDEAVSRVSDLEQFISSLEKDLETKNASFNELLNEKNTLISKVEVDEKTITGLTIEQSSLVAKLEEFEHVKTDHAKALKKIADTEKALATATAESKGKDKQIELLNNQINEANSKLTANQKATSKANSDLKLITNNLSDAEKQIATLTERAKRIDTLEPQIAKLTDETAEAKAELKLTLKALETTKQELEKANKPKPRARRVTKATEPKENK